MEIEPARGICRARRRSVRVLKASIISALLIGAVAFGLWSGLFVELVTVSSSSMLPTLKDGQHLLVQRSVYGGATTVFTGTLHLRRGDIVVVRLPGETAIKRVIALAGDRVRINGGIVFVNGVPLREPYVIHDPVNHSGETWPEDIDNDGQQDIQIPKETVFVLGDNRSYSADSRYWGPIPISDIGARVLLAIP